MANTHHPTTDPSQPPIYQIRVKGRLSRQWTDWFGGLTITPEDNGDTLLTGPVVDQAALHGLLRRVRDLGLPLLSVTRLEPEQADGPDVQPRVVPRLQARAADTGAHDDPTAPDLLSLTVPEVRRLVLALAEAAERRAFRFAWSRWHRAHQARAARHRDAGGRHPPDVAGVTALPPEPASGLTDAESALVQPLLPPQRPPRGRPRHDHRTVLSGIVWVLRRRDSWRAVPKACGKWEMVYKRYQLWRAEGRWQRIASALGLEERELSL